MPISSWSINYWCVFTQPRRKQKETNLEIFIIKRQKAKKIISLYFLFLIGKMSDLLKENFP